MEAVLRFALASALSASLCLQAGLVNAQDFEWAPVPPLSKTIEIDGLPYVQETSGNSWSLQRAKNSASAVFRFEVRSGDEWPEDKASGETKERSELDGYKRTWKGKTPLWVAYSFLIEPGPSYKSDWTSISQMHGSELRPFFVLFKGEELSIIAERRKDSNVAREQLFAGKLTRGVWHQAVYELVQSSSGDGRLRGWIDGQQIVDYRGPIGSDTNKAYWKFGVYRGYGPIATPIAIQYANMEIRSGDLSDRIKSPAAVK